MSALEKRYDEIASLLGVNEKTVRRHWELAKVWLFRAIQNAPPGADAP